MTSDGPRFPERPVQPTAPAPSEDDPLAASLRGFGPIGIVSMAVILLAGNVNLGNFVVVPLAEVRHQTG
jgi:hypothetical protein